MLIAVAVSGDISIPFLPVSYAHRPQPFMKPADGRILPEIAPAKGLPVDAAVNRRYGRAPA